MRAARAAWSPFTYAWYVGSSTVAESDWTITYSVLTPACFAVNFWSTMSCALMDSGLFVKEMSLLSTPASSVPEMAPIATNKAIQTPMTRHGW